VARRAPQRRSDIGVDSCRACRPIVRQVDPFSLALSPPVKIAAREKAIFPVAKAENSPICGAHSFIIYAISGVFFFIFNVLCTQFVRRIMLDNFF